MSNVVVGLFALVIAGISKDCGLVYTSFALAIVATVCFGLAMLGYLDSRRR